MPLIILALVWIAILVPIGIRHFRANGTERSIESFHAEHEVLSRQEYTVAPAHRLDTADQVVEMGREIRERPRLTVVHADDTYRSLESRSSWDEWSEDYDYDDRRGVRAVPPSTNRYASAYSSVPDERMTMRYEETVRHHVSMKVRRTRIFLGLVAAAVFFTLCALMINVSLIQDLAVLCWLGLVGFVAAALFAVSQGFLHESSLPLRRSSRGLATIETLRPEARDEYDSEFYEADDEGQWHRESVANYALG